MTKFIKIFILLIITSSVLSAQILEKINIRGNQNFDAGDYNAWLRINNGSKVFPGILDSAMKRISLGLAEEGYFRVSFEGSSLVITADSQKAVLNIDVQEGEPTYINRINVTGANLTDSTYIKKLFENEKGGVFRKSDLESSFSGMLDYFQERGLPFARVIISSIYFYSDSLSGKDLADIYLKVDNGRLSRIDKIEIKGNSKTRDFVILRELNITKGLGYSQRAIEEIPKKLNRLRFFEPVEVLSYYFNSKNEGILSIEIKERETNNFDGLIGYLPGAKPDEKDYLTGLVNITLRNLLGTGRSAAIHWQQLDRNSQELELKYLEPWLLGYPFNINLGLFQQKQDSTYVQRRLDGSVEYLATENISASLLVSSESVIPSIDQSAVFTVYNSSALTTGFNLKADTRDDIYSPKEGFYLLNTYSFSRKKINGPQNFISPSTKLSIYLQRFSIDLSFFKGVFSNQVIALALHARELKGEGFEVSDLYRLGGTNSLRGYRENQFLANRVAWSNLELRQLLTRRSYGFLFFDSGYYLRSEDAEKNIPRASAFKSGYGLGLNIETGLGVLSVSYALANGDSFSQGKIHFGLINEF